MVMRKEKVSFGDIQLYNDKIADTMNTVLNDSWYEKYGLVITDVAINDLNITDESLARVNKIDDATIFQDKNLQSGLMANATAEAMNKAASNANGAMTGFMGMNMAGNMGAGAINAVNDAQAKEQATQAQALKFCPNCGAPANGNFCGQCGTKLN